MSFQDRYLKLCNRRGSDWWSIVFGYPVARALLVPMADQRWLSPTLITVVGFLIKVVAGLALLCPDPIAVWIAIAALQVAQVFDSMDGTLARYRQTSSPLGAYLDKVSDALAMVGLCLAVGWRATTSSGQAHFLLLAAAAAGMFVVGCYALWVARAVRPEPGTRLDGGAPPLTGREVFAEWGRGWLQIWRFQEADLYFWLALGAAFGEWQCLTWALFATQTGKGLVVLVARGWQVARPS